MKKIFKYTISLILAFTMCVLFMTESTEQILIAEAKTEKQLADEIQESKDKIKEYNNEIENLKGDIEKQEEYQAVLEEKIRTVETMITDLIDKINLLDLNIATAENNLVIQEQNIVNGVNNFKSKLRAMYLSGTDSYASLLLGTADFYDLLMKVELITEVAEKDDQDITDLIALKNDFEQQKIELEAKKLEVEEIKKEQEETVASLDSLYEDSISMQNHLQSQQEMYEEMSEEKKAQIEKDQKELDRMIEERRNK